MIVDGRQWGSFLVVRLIGLLLWVCWTASPAAADDDAWQLLATARAEFELGGWSADFVQTYLPAGFSSGESESGVVSLRLPHALRWDYALPYAKAFLVLRDTAYAWNPGEAAGRRVLLEAAEREHLSLLELDVEALRERYAAEFVDGQDAGSQRDGTENKVVRIELVPFNETSEVRRADLALDRASLRLLALSYSDPEGNTTEFALSGHRTADDDALYEPPAGLEWIDE